jgi:high-affinity iron transporter
MLLLVMNWFFHRVYWTGWIASFHNRKKRILSGAAGLWVGLLTLGFSSVYREGFETVIFLQALSLEGQGNAVALGASAALAAVILLGWLAFRLEVKIPYRQMLVLTGILLGGVLVIMVGNAARTLQLVGWLPASGLPAVSLPLWLGTWFGLYATWQGVGLQATAAAFVLASYVLAENRLRRGRRSAPARRQPGGAP